MKHNFIAIPIDPTIEQPLTPSIQEIRNLPLPTQSLSYMQPHIEMMHNRAYNNFIEACKNLKIYSDCIELVPVDLGSNNGLSNQTSIIIENECLGTIK